MAPELYNLSLTKRPSHLFAGPGQEKISEHKVDLTYHHIVPYNRLEGCWNALVAHGHLQGCRLLPLLWEKVTRRHYVNLTPPTGGKLGDTDANHVADLILSLYEGAIAHNADARLRPTGWDNFMGVYAWLPGNLFVGPQNRCDDPGEDFDQAAIQVLQGARKRRCDTLVDADGKLQKFVAAATDRKLAAAASSALRDVADYLRIEGYDGTYWAWNPVKEKPQIRGKW